VDDESGMNTAGCRRLGPVYVSVHTDDWTAEARSTPRSSSTQQVHAVGLVR